MFPSKKEFNKTIEHYKLNECFELLEMYLEHSGNRGKRNLPLDYVYEEFISVLKIYRVKLISLHAFINFLKEKQFEVFDAEDNQRYILNILSKDILWESAPKEIIEP